MNNKFYEILRSFVPEIIAERISIDPHHLDRLAEKRWATVLFADITGFTPLCERLSPEEVMMLLDKLFSSLANSIRRYGGVVDKFLGDAIMALFGAPTSHPDDPQRAILSAMEMIKDVRKFNRSAIAKKLGAKISISIGINSGNLVSVLVGDDNHREYTVIGDTVNTAARLEQNANPLEILIGENTRQKVLNDFELEFLGKISLKGKSEAQPVWKVVGIKEKAIISRQEREFFHSKSAESFIDNLFAEKNGHFALVGDSITLDYWRRFFKYKNPDTILVQAIRHRGFSIPEAILKKIPQPKGDDETAHKQYIEDLKNLVSEKICGRTVLVSHSERADDGSIEVMKDIDNAKIIWLGEKLPFKKVKYFRLKNLSQKEVRQKIKKFFSISAISKKDFKKIWDITRGASGHLWHILKFLKENNGTEIFRSTLHIASNIELPADISNYVIAKIDSLPSETRDIVLSASVLGEKFPHKLLSYMIENEKILPLPEEIFEISGENIRFRWEIFQQACYSMLTAQTKRRLHFSAVKAYKKMAAEESFFQKPGGAKGKRGKLEENLKKFAQELAYHYERCGRWKSAFRYLLVAGDEQKRRWAYRAASEFYRRADEIATRMYHRWHNTVQLVDVLFKESEIFWNTGKYSEAMQINRRAARIAVKSKEISLLYGALMRIAVIFNNTGKITYAEKLYQKALKLLDELPENPRRKLQLMVNIGVIKSNLNRLSEGKEIFLQALSIAKKIGDSQTTASLLTNLGWIFEKQGKPHRAVKLHRLAMKMDRENNNILAEAEDLVNLAIALKGIGRIDDAIISLERAKKLFEKIGDFVGLAFALNSMGEFLRENGDRVKILKIHRKALKLAKSAGEPFLVADVLLNIALDYIALKDMDRAKNYLKRAKQSAQKCNDMETVKKVEKIYEKI